MAGRVETSASSRPGECAIVLVGGVCICLLYTRLFRGGAATLLRRSAVGV